MSRPMTRWTRLLAEAVRPDAGARSARLRSSESAWTALPSPRPSVIGVFDVEPGAGAAALAPLITQGLNALVPGRVLVLGAADRPVDELTELIRAARRATPLVVLDLSRRPHAHRVAFGPELCTHVVAVAPCELWPARLRSWAAGYGWTDGVTLVGTRSPAQHRTSFAGRAFDVELPYDDAFTPGTEASLTDLPLPALAGVEAILARVVATWRRPTPLL